MAKKGKLRPQDWGPIMPAHSPLSQKGPWYYRDTEAVVMEFLVDEAWALSVLPDDLELVEPAAGFIVMETNHRTTLGPYSEIYTAILCTYKGVLYGYCPAVYVTGENSQIVGREVYGFGKKRADRISVTSHGNGTVEVIMDVLPGDNALRAVMQPSENQGADAFGALPLVCLRICPDAEGGDIPALAQLVSVEFTAKPLIGSDGRAEVYMGPGSIEFGTKSDASMPIVAMGACRYARFNADLPYGKVLKTFTAKEFKTSETLQTKE